MVSTEAWPMSLLPFLQEYNHSRVSLLHFLDVVKCIIQLAIRMDIIIGACKYSSFLVRLLISVA